MGGFLLRGHCLTVDAKTIANAILERLLLAKQPIRGKFG